MFLVISMEVIMGIYESFMGGHGILLWYYSPAMENPRTKWTCFFLQEIIELNEGNSINGGPQDGWLMENTFPKNEWFFRVPPAIRKPPNGIVRLINVGETMSFLPPMTGNGNHTTYWWWWLGDGLWHCFTDITPSSFRGAPCHGSDSDVVRSKWVRSTASTTPRPPVLHCSPVH